MSLETINVKLLGLRPGDRLLDLGCGQGRHAISFFLQADINVVGLDQSDADLSVARQRLTELTAGNTHIRTCKFLKGDGLNLPFAEHSFDQVVCSEVLEHIPDYPKMLQEIRRVLKPGGTLAVSVPSFFPEWICWQLSDAYHEVEGGHVRIFREGELRAAIEALDLQFLQRHRAHSLHVPYWWLKCLFWRDNNAGNPDSDQDHWLVQRYHQLLVWDLMQQPAITYHLDQLLNPLLGKSTAMYFLRR